MNKKAMIFLGSILGLIILTIILIIFIRFKGQSPAASTATNQTPSNTTAPAPVPAPAPAPTPSPVSLPPAATGPTKMSDSSAASAVLSYDGKLLWYFTADGHLYNVNVTSGAKQEYILPNNYKVDNVIWPSVGNDFIIESDNGLGKSFYYYDGQTKNFITYPANVKEVDFMPDGYHVLYEWLPNTGKPTLSIANFDLTGHREISTLPDNDDVIKVSPQRNRAFYYKNNAPADGKIYYVNLDTGKTIIIKTASSNAVIWSPDSTHFVYNRLDKDNNNASALIWLGDLDSNTDRSLGVSVPVSKVAFNKSGSTLYLAQPDTSGSGDAFWSMDTKTQQKTQIYSGGNFTATNLLVSNDGANLYFKNFDGFIYSLPIH